MLDTMTWFTILVVLQVLFATSFVDSELVLECPAGYVQKDSYCYRKVYATFLWKKAEDACERDGSRLVWIDDWNENDYVHNLLDMGQEMYWTGLREMEGDWKWTGNSEVYDLRLGFWEPSQPDTSNSGPECVAGMAGGNWKRVSCMEKLPFICKTPAYPPGSFKCSKGLKAISGKWKCDGYRDCDDKSDEVDCDTAPYCNWYSTVMPGSKSITYQGSKTCLYTLKANIGERISLTISSQSAIELKADSLIAYSGGLTLSESYMIGTVEGSLSTGQRFISGNHFLIIRMTTDSSVERRPISIAWTNVVPEITNLPRELTGTSSYKTLMSPFFGSTLPPDLSEEWVITAQSPGQIITLMFDNVILESKSSMEVYDGDMTKAVLSGVQSIPDPAMYISYSKAVKIRLSTSTAIQPLSSGFKIRYKEGCVITIDPAKSGTIMTPGFQTGKYPRNVACSWELKAPTMKKLTLRTRSFNLKENIDYMKVYNATSSSATSFTGEISSPMRLLSDVGYFKIEFTSDNVRTGVGFKLKYSIDCDPWMTSQETNIAYSEMPYTSFESNISVTCKNGYSFMQEEYNTMAVVPMVCEEGGKWNVSRNPDCRITHCPIPPKISNGWIKEASGTVAYGRNVTYVCEDGFVLSSSATIKCKADGTWENAPACTSTSCGVLPTVVNGNTRNLTATQNQYGDVIEYYCDEGYETVGPSFAYCQINGTWSHSVPTCKALTCPLVPVMNAFWKREDGVPFSTTGMLNCSDGYKWNVTNSRVISVTCQANGTFLNMEDCVDIDECKDVPNSCSALEDCDNTIGGFMCHCKEGYFRNSSTSSCQDILECSVNNGGCSNTCNEESPGYSCSCPSGYELFTESNQNNITLPIRETGLRQGDIFYFNHTCVRKTCDALYHPSDGQRLTENAYTFYYEDVVYFVCDIGYKLVGSKNVTCEANRQWSASPPTCTRQFCTVPTHTDRMLNSSIAQGGMAYLTDPVVFQCQYGNQVLERKMYCSYMGNGQYDWQGDDYSCPEINCGEPKVVPAGIYTSKTGNSWKDTFNFGCDNGFTKSGNSTNNNYTVTCQENGRWGFGSLTCTGDLCTDPGTPYNAVQIATSYEVGQTVTWTCERNGYTPDPPTVLLCQIVGSIVNWNSTDRPTCKDTQNPTFSSCPTETFYVHKSHPVVYTTPTAQDNTNGLKSITVQPENMESGSIINENTTITYTAEDYTGNTGTCEINVVVIEDSVPSLSCPNNSVYYINTTNGYSINPLDLVSSQPWTSLKADPPSLSVNFDSLNILQKVRVTASYKTVTSSCSFLIATEASACLTASVPSIAWAGKSCTENVQCTIDCKLIQGVQYFHSDTGLKEKQYNCTGANNWSPAISNTPCVSHDNPEYSMTVTAPFSTSQFAGDCLDAFNVQLPAFYNVFEANYGCQGFINGTVVRDEKTEVGSLNKIILNITINLDRAATDSNKQACLTSFMALLNIDVVSPLRFFPSTITCKTGVSTVSPVYLESTVTSSGYSCSTPGRVLKTIDTENKCVPTIPGTFEENGVSVNCTDGLYQDAVGQTSCKQCPDGTVAAATRDACLNTCPRGFMSDDGFPPCRPCSKDYYWSNSTYCEQCPPNTSTVEQNGMEVLGDCKAECQAGMFSPTGYEPCKPCPQNFHQALTGQKKCMECAGTQITNSTGSNNSNQCWTPELCPASPTPCSGNGSCSVKNHEKFCVCNPGYSGSDCQIMNNFCGENPCVKGTCSNVQGTSFTCTCDTGFTGDRCDRDTTNPCASNPCKAGSCRNIKSSTDCLCPLTGGFTQPICERLDNLCDGVQCSNRGTCVAFGSVRKQCICQPGYTGENCETNINECTLNPQGCLYNSTCIDGVNTYSCQCRPGFSGDMCHVRNDFCRTDPCADAECYNDYDSFKSVCVCHEGFEVQDAGNGKCTSKVKCPLGNAVCNNGTCSEDDCFCLSGYTGSRCQHDFTDCTMNTCENGGTCVDKLMDYDCMCMSGYIGKNCNLNIDDCLGQCQGKHVVSTGLRCMDKVNDFMCNCAAGWTGKNCTENIDECASYPCRHGASCTDGDNTYTCNCTTGWTGKNCDTAINNCPDNTCNNEGKCFNMNEDFFCSCLGGTTGKTCSNFPPVCNILSPCTAQGNCVDEEGTAKCNCKPNYTGSSCQLTTYHCGTDPCRYDGTCVTGSGMDFSCSCRDSYFGTRCGGYTDPCSSQPCSPGANCLSDKDKYLCSCPGGAVPTDTQCKSTAPIGELSVDGMVDTRGTYLNNPFVFSNTDMFSVMLWVLCSNDTYNNPIILALEERDIHHQEPGWMDSPPTSNYLLKMTNEGVVFDNGTDFKMVEFGKNICDKKWHHVSVTYHKNGTSYVKLDSTPKDPFMQTVPRSFSKVFQVLLGQSFLGKISQVMIWNKVLSTSNQLLAFDNVNNIPDRNEIVQNWMNYAQTKSVKFSPTITIRDNNPMLEDELQMTEEKMPPAVVNCPPYRKKLPMSDEQIVNIPGLKNSIDFTHPTDITKYTSVADGESYTRGRFVLVFYAIDGMKNFAMCRFPLYIQYDDCPAPVFNSALTDFSVGSNMKAHTASCQSNNLAINGPIPEFFHCTNLGVYNPDEPYDSFLLPACGAIGTTSYQVAVDLLYDLVITCSSADQNTFANTLRTRLTTAGVCDNNCEITPNLRCDTPSGKLLRVSFTLTGLLIKITINVNGNLESFSPFEALTHVVYYTDAMDFENVVAGAILRKNVQSITITQSLSCASGYQLVGEQCVQCSMGQYYDSNTKMCKFCQKNTYTDEAGQTSCKPCNDNKVTLNEGANSLNLCVENCTAGHFYNKSSNSCQKCAKNFYQENTGMDYCNFCPIQKITTGIGSDSFADCNDDCPVGEERVESNQACVKCPIGMYRTQLNVKCIPCPSEFTTVKEGTTDESGCDIRICYNGTFRNKSNLCEDCATGYYQDENFKDECKKCSTSESTRNTGSNSSSQCEFVCGAGEEIITGQKKCKQCERGFFHTGDHPGIFNPCKKCPTNKTTEVIGSTHEDNCTIEICAKGQEVNSSGDSCIDCPYNTFQEKDMPTSYQRCLDCGGSKATEDMKTTNYTDCKFYCPLAGTQNDGNDNCESCPRGTFRSVDDHNTTFSPCENCTDGWTTEGQGSKSSHNCSIEICSKGQELNSSGVCLDCPYDYYQDIEMPKSVNKCQHCGSNKATKNMKSTSNSSCKPYCKEPGTELNDQDMCVPCARGTYRSVEDRTKYFTPCMNCSNGKTTEWSGSISNLNCSIDMCSAGEVVNSAGNCERCPKDYYQPITYPNSTVTCIKCTSNKATMMDGQTSKDSCVLVCSAGQQYNNVSDQCEPCNKGTWNNANETMKFEQCASCPVNYTTTGGSSTDLSNCTVLFCDKGFKYDGTSSPARCDPCKQGEYKEARGRATSCTPCDPGFTTSGEASKNRSDCDQPYCVIGKFYNSADQSCQPCPIGFYKDTVGNTNCTACNTGFTTAVKGANSRVVCTVVVCRAGEKRNTLVNTCEVCLIGQYQPDEGQITCIPCSPGNTTRTASTVSQSDCVDNCSPGYEFNTTTGKCVACALGTHKSRGGNWEADRKTVINCTPCSPLKTTPSTASTSPNDCSLDLCDVGTYQKDGACVSCEKATYQDKKGQTECKSCGASKTTKVSSGAKSIEDCIPDCDLGKDFNFSSPDCCCTDCAISYYVDKSVGEFCIKCPTGLTNVSPGSKTCGFTDNIPTVTERVTTTIQLQISIPEFDCSNEIIKNIYVSNVKIKLITRFKALRFDICLSPSCDNINSIVVVIPITGGCIQGGRRRKRATGATLNLDVSANSLPNPATSTDNSANKRPIQDLINEMVNTDRSSIVPSGSTLTAASVTGVTQQCTAGQRLVGTTCDQCPMGTYENLGSCNNCPVNQYQDDMGQTTCKQCSDFSTIKIYTAGTNSTSVSQCLSTCDVNSNYCKNGGECVADQTVYCKCGSRYSGTNCEKRSEPDDSTWIYIVAGTIGGLVFLLIIIIVTVVFCRRSGSPKTKIVYEKQDPSHNNRGYQNYPDAAGYPYQQAMMSQHAMSQALPETYYMPYQQPYQQPRAITNRQYRGFEVDEDNSSGYKWTSFSEH